ncbi:MAG: polysaccharide deacetylase family protein [Erysipelotrichaceae bacterium]|nr:polysaccharide deacetylase family protein [Erysipelotrichaceae bacterium]
MAKRKRRRIRKGVLAAGIVIILVFLFLIIRLITNINFHFIGKHSVNEDAARYKTRTCLVFYPKQMDSSFTKELCEKSEEEKIYDYTLTKEGDYVLVDYGNDYYFVLTSDYKPIKVTSISDRGRQIISDFVRLEAKKNHPDTYYSTSFLEASYYTNLDVSEERFEVDRSEIIYTMKETGITVRIPMKYIQEEVGIHFPIAHEDYVRETYIDPTHPMIALTFDDGPYSPVGQQIVDILSYYDGNATFFVVGNRLSNKQLEFMKDSIERGNQYGSHTSDHVNLNKVDLDTGVYQVMDTVNYVRDHLGYQMTIYRSPYGSHNSSVSTSTGLRDVLWKVDSLDWSSRDASSIKEIVYAETDENDVVLFHELYQSTADAIADIVPYFVGKGYQLVTIDQLMEHLDYQRDISVAFHGQ